MEWGGEGGAMMVGPSKGESSDHGRVRSAMVSGGGSRLFLTMWTSWTGDLPVGGQAEILAKKNLAVCLFFQLIHIQNFLTKISCMRATEKKVTRTCPFCIKTVKNYLIIRKLSSFGQNLGKSMTLSSLGLIA